MEERDVVEGALGCLLGMLAGGRGANPAHTLVKEAFATSEAFHAEADRRHEAQQAALAAASSDGQAAGQ